LAGHKAAFPRTVTEPVEVPFASSGQPGALPEDGAAVPRRIQDKLAKAKKRFEGKNTIEIKKATTAA
jgi:hypothetical protein